MLTWGWATSEKNANRFFKGQGFENQNMIQLTAILSCLIVHGLVFLWVTFQAVSLECVCANDVQCLKCICFPALANLWHCQRAHIYLTPPSMMEKCPILHDGKRWENVTGWLAGNMSMGRSCGRGGAQFFPDALAFCASDMEMDPLTSPR